MSSTSRRRFDLLQLEDRATPATIVGLTSTNSLVTFDSSDPTKIVTTVKVSGLQKGDDLVGLDARPATGQLYAPSKLGFLYVLDAQTGVATAVSATPFTPLPKGAPYGADFNPVVDRLRFVASGTGEQNLRINQLNGTVAATDTPLAYAAGDANEGRNPTVVAAAYTNNYLGATQTTLFALDAGRDTLVRIGSANGTPNSPNGGLLETVGPLGAKIGNAASFDIAQDGTAYAAVKVGTGPTRLATVNLTTGALTLLPGKIGSGGTLDGMAVLPRDEIVCGVTAANRLISFRADTPGALLSSFPISGLNVGESIIGLDVRPATGELFALTDTNQVLRIDTRTGQGIRSGPAIDGAAFGAGVPGGFDFNPAADRLRLVNGANDNLRYNPVTFTAVDTDAITPGVQGDPDLAYAALDPNSPADPNIVGAAYDRNDNDGTTPTTLFGIDSALNILVRQGGVDGTPSPNLGVLTTIGALGVDPTDEVAFDIAGAGSGGLAPTSEGGIPLVVMQLEGETRSKLFSINLATGAATLVGTVGGGDVVRAMAIAPPRVGFASTSLSVSEKSPTAQVVLTRTGGSYGTARVRISAFEGTATAGADFTAFNDLEVVFAPGETRKVVTVTILQDKFREPSETVHLALSALTGTFNNVVLDNPSAVLTILDDGDTMAEPA